jgi:hypothetical protein
MPTIVMSKTNEPSLHQCDYGTWYIQSQEIQTSQLECVCWAKIMNSQIQTFWVTTDVGNSANYPRLAWMQSKYPTSC